MPPLFKTLTGRENARTVGFYGESLAVKCRKCGRKALIPQKRLYSEIRHDMEALARRKFRCKCGSDDVEWKLPYTKEDAEAFMREE